jgi:hypothetical protein
LGAWVNLIRWSISKTSRLGSDMRDWHGVEDLLNQMAKLAPKSAAVVLLWSEVRKAQGRGAEAESLLEAEKNKNPKDIAFWIALVDLAIHDNHLDRARQTLEEAEKTLGDHAALRLARVRYLVLKGEKDATEQLRKIAEESKDFSPQEQVQLWRAMIPASLALSDFPEAERLGQLVMARSPGDLRVHLDLFELASQAGDVPLMDSELGKIAELDKIAEIRSNGPVWHYAMALRLIFSGDMKRGQPAENASSAEQQRRSELQKALDHLAAARRSRPNFLTPERLQFFPSSKVLLLFPTATSPPTTGPSHETPAPATGSSQPPPKNRLLEIRRSDGTTVREPEVDCQSRKPDVRLPFGIQTC